MFKVKTLFNLRIRIVEQKLELKVTELNLQILQVISKGSKNKLMGTVVKEKNKKFYLLEKGS